MNFRIDCDCGNDLTVTEGAAGGSVQCPCGRTIAVPSMKELRLQAGLPPYNIAPELMIEHLLAAGQLPGTKTCARCGAETDDSIQVVTECERIWIKRTGGFSWLTLIVSTIFFPVRIWLWEQRDEREYGKDKVYILPLPVCGACQPAMRGRKAIKQGLNMVPEYARLLEKFPDATVAVR